MLADGSEEARIHSSCILRFVRCIEIKDKNILKGGKLRHPDTQKTNEK